MLRRLQGSRELVLQLSDCRPPPLVIRALDRLTHHVHILEINVDSYRLKQSKQRQRRT